MRHSFIWLLSPGPAGRWAAHHSAERGGSCAGAAREAGAVAKHQIRRLVLYVHAVRLSAVCAAQVRCRIQLDRQSPVWYFLVD